MIAEIWQSGPEDTCCVAVVFHSFTREVQFETLETSSAVSLPNGGVSVPRQGVADFSMHLAPSSAFTGNSVVSTGPIHATLIVVKVPDTG